MTCFRIQFNLSQRPAIASIDASPDELTAAGHHEFVSMDRRLLEGE